MWLANEPAVVLVLLYGTLRVQRKHAWDQKVTGASPVTSPCDDGYGKQGGDGYDDQTEAGLGGNDQGLTTVTKRCSARSGTVRSRRI